MILEDGTAEGETATERQRERVHRPFPKGRKEESKQARERVGEEVANAGVAIADTFFTPLALPEPSKQFHTVGSVVCCMLDLCICKNSGPGDLVHRSLALQQKPSNLIPALPGADGG